MRFDRRLYCVLLDEERNTNSGASARFRRWVEDNGLIDIPNSGNRFTWSHSRSVDSRRAARLDRDLCCDA